MNPIFAALFALSLTVSASAANRLLIPLAFDASDGAYLSRWTAIVTFYNGGDAPVTFVPTYYECPADLHSKFCDDWGVQDIPANATVRIPYGFTPGGFGVNGAVVEFLTGDPSAVTAHIRVRELSRGADAVGTEVRAVWEDDLLTGTAEMIDVTTGTSLRTTLRIYQIDSREPVVFRVRVFDEGAADPSADLLVNVPGTSLDGVAPGTAVLSGITGASGKPLRIEVTPVNPGIRYWTFISVTNNDSQLVTTISPR